ncbi:MAG: 3-hydroxybutyryl-CoA dehydrogenase [Methanomicrobiales archaeon HGW-Methanomicrobiales-1]|jgi:3-hydroxybutyryl-CoA dehydrogenase|nr:MAG: 3-hydroxybutyryl-CoA dehydrogenase [Methanomicrobiales archaeon HGW-Methanomicrobiales-1]
MHVPSRVLIVGIGTMGAQIALQFAMHGFTVRLFNTKTASLDRAMKDIAGLLDSLIANGYCTEKKETVLGRISTCTDEREAARDIDLISESVPDDPGLKGELFARFHALCPAHTLFLSNTSHLIPSLFAERSGRPRNLLAFHFGNPVWKERVLDVMPHPGTDPEAVKIACEVARRIDQVPIVFPKEHSGYIMNHMEREYLKVAFEIVSTGVANYKDVDKAWLLTHGSTPPFACIDLMGIDHSYDVAMRAAGAGDNGARLVADYLHKNFISKGKFGKKSGEGFYRYPDPEFAQPGFIEQGLRHDRNFRHI